MAAVRLGRSEIHQVFFPSSKTTHKRFDSGHSEVLSQESIRFTLGVQQSLHLCYYLWFSRAMWVDHYCKRYRTRCFVLSLPRIVVANSNLTYTPRVIASRNVVFHVDWFLDDEKSIQSSMNDNEKSFLHRMVGVVMSLPQVDWSSTWSSLFD